MSEGCVFIEGQLLPVCDNPIEIRDYLMLLLIDIYVLWCHEPHRSSCRLQQPAVLNSERSSRM